MKKRFPAIILALFLCAGLFPLPASAADIEGPPSKDFSQYLTGDPLRKEELTLGGRPFYEVSLAEVPSIFPILEYKNSYTYMDGPEDAMVEMECYGTFSQTGEYAVHTNMSARQRVGDTTLESASYFAVKSKAGKIEKLETEIRDIATTDSLESVLEKLGVSTEGAPVIAAEMMDHDTNFNIVTGETSGSSYMNAFDVNGDGFDAPAIRWMDSDGRICASFLFREGLLSDVMLSDLSKSIYLDHPAAASPEFTDVSPDAWYADAVNWAVEKGITNGTTTTTFSPGQDCTEIQILTFLWRAKGRPKAASTVTDFSFLPGDYGSAANWAYDQEIIDDSFHPDALCTRAQAVSYIWQALGEPDAKASSFTDVPAGAPYAKAVDWAVEKGVTKGTNADGTAFSPDQVCSRGHIVTFLQRACND